MKPDEFQIRPVTLRQHGCEYVTFEVVGYLDSTRVRKRFKSRDEAVAEKNALEIKSATADAQVRTAVTRLTDVQLAAAEACCARLGNRDLFAVVDWYLANYRPPCVDKLLAEANEAFLAALKPNVGAVHWTDVRIRMNAFCAAFPERLVHSLKSSEIEAYLNGHGWAPKTFNNTRGALSSFFEYCVHKDRRWAESNPVTGINQKKVARGLPEIESAERIKKLFAFLETYTGGPRRPHKPGFLVPYFALATFAGMRPSVPAGEVCKLGRSEQRTRLLNFKTGVIHVTPDIAKTDDIRAIKIRPNLAAWLGRYPLEDYPIVMPNMEQLVSNVRKHFGLGDDVLRHTFCSAHVAKFKSIGEAAIEAGNSESIIRQHYLNVMNEEDADAFWSIFPQKE